MNKVKLKDIAKEAGVSPATVSLLLNNKKLYLRKEKREKILELVEKYNYKPNSAAVALITKKTKMIGLIIPDIQNSFFNEIAKHVESYASALNYGVLLCNTNNNEKEELKYIDSMYDRNIDGLLISLSDGNSANYKQTIAERMDRWGKPFITMDRFIEEIDCSRVSVDHHLGGYLAAQYLIERNHKKIGCITGPQNSHTAQKRYNGFLNAMRQNNLEIDPNLIAVGDYTFDSGYINGLQLLKNKPTAVFALNDLMACGLYKAARELKMEIPKDVSVIGFDNIFFSSMLEVPLTTIKQNTEELVKASCDILFKSMQQKDGSIKEIVSLKPQIIERQSVRKLD